ncbi:DNA-binding transcriptional regulator LsrR, DeoR family [Virgibacillus subterraneus]|uniref:DNA-binding transcriptional regulator LsrR, DeoR family n=2 Tax=Virgibacillus TaxID=84406 RepID=A0A1H0YLH8_9BACI|nr:MULTISPECIES: sugar-binding transcriptional regulator [Virgibacillus]SDQ15900.1 DNA-binding transcriptional regulator LsrR, DeoR family [Virgibacillus salinus]SEP77658.1 DNA-binding transcriptional regulator LsrR, DeoR family [Virgibacillus subterraneus]
MLNWEERRLMVKVAKLYYFEGWTQAQIAARNNVSRPVISKLLNNAKKEGIVEIYIKDETVQTVELEQTLEKKYGLSEVIVVSTAGFAPDMAKRQLGKTAASYIAKNLKGIKSLGISWGTTLLSLIEEYPYERRDDINIVPIVGGMGSDYVHLHSNQLAFNLAQKMNTSCSYLYAPAMVESDELKERLVNSKDIAHVLERGRNVDMALVGLGNPFKSSTMETIGYLEESDLASLRKAGAVGDISSRFFDAVGKEVDHPLNNRVIGLNLDEIRNIPEVIGIVEGSYKLESIEAALKGGYLNVLITDDRTAQELLEE